MVNQPNGKRAILVNSRPRSSREKVASTRCNHRVIAAASVVPAPSSDHRGDPERPEAGGVGAGEQQPGQLDQEHERRELDDRDDRLQHARHDQRRLQRCEQPAARLAPPASSDDLLGGCSFGLRDRRLRCVRSGVGLTVPRGAHRSALGPVGLGVDLLLGEAELIAHPSAQVLEGACFRSDPGVPVRPVPGLEGGGQRRAVPARHAVNSQSRVLGERDEQVVVSRAVRDRPRSGCPAGQPQMMLLIAGVEAESPISR